MPHAAVARDRVQKERHRQRVNERSDPEYGCNGTPHYERSSEALHFLGAVWLLHIDVQPGVAVNRLLFVATFVNSSRPGGMPARRKSDLGEALHEQIALDQGDDEMRHATAGVFEEPESIASGPHELRF